MKERLFLIKNKGREIPVNEKMASKLVGKVDIVGEIKDVKVEYQGKKMSMEEFRSKHMKTYQDKKGHTIRDLPKSSKIRFEVDKNSRPNKAALKDQTFIDRYGNEMNKQEFLRRYGKE